VDSLRHLKVVFPGLADKKGAAALIVSALSGNALAWYQTLTADRKATLEEDGDALAKAIQDYFGPPQALASSARLETLHLPLDRLGGKLYFSTLDLQSGYWQIPMSPADAVKTAFHGPRGLYQFKLMPFGLKNAPASFQRAMDLVLAGLVGVSCWVYLDDIIIASSSFERHLVDLEAVLTRLQSAGFTVKLSKCTFAQPSLHFLGHVISKDGVRADPRKTQALHDMPAPKNVFELRSFLGGAGYFRRFIKGYGQIASPLTRLLKADVPFIWSEECRLAFETIKQALVAPTPAPAAPPTAAPRHTQIGSRARCQTPY